MLHGCPDFTTVWHFVFVLLVIIKRVTLRSYTLVSGKNLCHYDLRDLGGEKCVSLKLRNELENCALALLPHVSPMTAHIR